MQSLLIGALLALNLAHTAHGAAYTATYIPSDAPDKSENGQSGTNACGTTSSPTSQCQNVYINSVDDFCLFAPPASAEIGVDERICVSYCLREGYGTRLIPDGTITGAHFVQTVDYVQVTGVGDLTKINVKPGDGGGELDPHGADGNGNPIGGLVFGDSFGALQQYHEWTNYVGSNLFCLRACKDGPLARAYCAHIYDELGCFWNMPGDYDAGSFEDCNGDSTEPMGQYTSIGANGKITTSTFHQGQNSTPPAHTPGATSQCTPLATVSNQLAASPTLTVIGTSTVGVPGAPTSAPPSSTPSSGATPSSAAPTPIGTVPASANAAVGSARVEFVGVVAVVVFGVSLLI